MNRGPQNQVHPVKYYTSSNALVLKHEPHCESSLLTISLPLKHTYIKTVCFDRIVQVSLLCL